MFDFGWLGKPKPVVIPDLKAQGIGTSMPGLIDLHANDKMYTVLPLYHSAGGGLGFWGVIMTGLGQGRAQAFLRAPFPHLLALYKPRGPKVTNFLRWKLENVVKLSPGMSEILIEVCKHSLVYS